MVNRHESFLTDTVVKKKILNSNSHASYVSVMCELCFCKPQIATHISTLNWQIR